MGKHYKYPTMNLTCMTLFSAFSQMIAWYRYIPAYLLARWWPRMCPVYSWLNYIEGQNVESSIRRSTEWFRVPDERRKPFPFQAFKQSHSPPDMLVNPSACLISCCNASRPCTYKKFATGKSAYIRKDDNTYQWPYIYIYIYIYIQDSQERWWRSHVITYWAIQSVLHWLPTIILYASIPFSCMAMYLQVLPVKVSNQSKHKLIRCIRHALRVSEPSPLQLFSKTAREGVSNDQPHHCLLNRCSLIMYTSNLSYQGLHDASVIRKISCSIFESHKFKSHIAKPLNRESRRLVGNLLYPSSELNFVDCRLYQGSVWYMMKVIQIRVRYGAEWLFEATGYQCQIP